MNRLSLRLFLPICISLPAIAWQGNSATNVTLTGWFSDESCARSKVNSGEVGPNGRDCVQKCLKDGKKLVFIDEKAKALLFVENPSAASDQASNYVQITGTADRSAKTLHIDSVKLLEEYNPMCGRRPLKQ